MSVLPRSEIKEVLRALTLDVDEYFASVENVFKQDGKSRYTSSYEPANHFWDQLPPELQETARVIINQLLPICATLADQAGSSPLTGTEDLQDIKIATKTMRAALRLRKYSYREPDAIHDEGAILGFRPADQSENYALFPIAAKREFEEHLSRLGGVLKLIEATASANPGVSLSVAVTEPAKYLTGTAFIMMWMDPQHPELNDVADAVRSVFRSFEVRAVRADDIEHEGLITERILNEIRTSEFLFADLTGMRPNVYYEIGYAHALGKRVILFRKSGTGLHFDLAGYNCPEYENLRDLREKLSKRLVSLTNRNPNEKNDI